MGLELNYGLLLGTQDFFAYNVLRFAQPALIAVALVVLWGVDLSPWRARSSRPPSRCPVVGGGPGPQRRRVGWAASTCTWGCGTLWYGVRGQGNTVAANLNARLDVAIAPRVREHGHVGLYSVATNSR